MRPFLTVEAALVSGHARNAAGARELARFLVSRRAALLRATVGRQIVATPGVDGDPFLRAFRAQALAAVPMDNSPRMQSVWEPEKRALAAVMSGATSAEEALAQAQRRLLATTREAPPRRNPAPYL